MCTNPTYRVIFCFTLKYINYSIFFTSKVHPNIFKIFKTPLNSTFVLFCSILRKTFKATPVLLANSGCVKLAILRQRLGICVVRLTANFKIKYDTHLAYNIYTLLCAVNFKNYGLRNRKQNY